MKILFDQGVPKLAGVSCGSRGKPRFRTRLGHKKNGELLALAEEAGFEILVTTDQNLLHQQSLRGRKTALFILGRGDWPEIKPHAAQIAVENQCGQATRRLLFCD